MIGFFSRNCILLCNLQGKGKNGGYEITMNGYQVRKTKNQKMKISFFSFWKPSLALRPKLGCSPS